MRLADAQRRAEPQRAVDPRQHEVDRGLEGIEHRGDWPWPEYRIARRMGLTTSITGVIYR